MCDHFFEHMANEFSCGKLDLAASRFRYPAAVYLGKHSLVYSSPEEMRDALCAYKERLQVFKHWKTEAHVVDQTFERGRNRIIWVDWQHFDMAGNQIAKSSIKYFCSDLPDDGFRIQLAEYVTAPSACMIENTALGAEIRGAFAH